MSALDDAISAMHQQDHWLLPEGIQEVLPHEAQRLEVLRRELLDLFASWGYELVIPPFIEFLESLLTGTGHDLDLQTFKLTDHISGRLLGVRADMTPQVARIDAHNLQRDVPTRLCYMGTVLHARGDGLEKSRSPLQVGAELFGHAGIESDFEIVRLLLEMLAVAGIQDVHIDLGHVGIFRGLANHAKLTSVQESKIFDVMQRKASEELEALVRSYSVPEEIASMLLALPQLNGGDSVIDRARKELKFAHKTVAAALDYLSDLAARLKRLFPSLPLNFDLAELRGYHYQTGVVFAAFVPGYGREIARGGRYDDIGKIFGRARPATGFSADLKVLEDLTAVSEHTRIDKIFAPCSTDEGLDEKIRDLRTQGKIVIQELPDQQGTATDMDCDYRLDKRNGHWEVFLL